MSISTRWLPNEHGGSLLNINSGACYELNKVGGVIAFGISEGRSVEDIVALLQDSYGVKKDRLEKDVRDFLDKLLTMGLIESSD